MYGEDAGVVKKITTRLEDGTKKLFWKNKWLGVEALDAQFRNLYNEAVLK